MSDVPNSLGLRRLVNAYYRTRRETPRSPGFHPSQVSRDDFCPVFRYYMVQADEALYSDDPAVIRWGFEFKRSAAEAQRFPPHLYSEFVVGDAVHRMVQYQLGVVGKLWGKWKCAHCGHRTDKGYMPRTHYPGHNGEPIFDAAPCPRCNGMNRRDQMPWIYIEPWMRGLPLAKELGINGMMDGEVHHRVGDTLFRYVLEIKSINEFGWCEGKNTYWEDLALAAGWTAPPGWVSEIPRDYRVLPKADHVRQSTLYAACHGITHILFIYVNKNAVSKWKEIVAPLDPEILAAVRGRIDAVNVALADGSHTLADARVCSDPRDEMARKCPACSMCFGRDAPESAWR